MELNIHRLAEMLSLTMTIPTVVLAIAVVYLWFPAARAALKADRKDARQWFILGVVFGFIGSAIDNVYWFMPWSASFMGESDLFRQLTDIGVFFNIILRQGFGIAAAYCHIKASEMSSIQNIKFVNRLMVCSYLTGLGYVLLMGIHIG
jgi:hypothetical protein